MRSSSLALLGLLVGILGCGASAKKEPLQLEAANAGRQADEALGQDRKPPAPNAGKDETPRKIIYTANLELIVENFDKATEELDRLIKEQQGFVAASNVKGERGRQRSGTWTVRVPEAHFNALVAAVAQLGEALENRVDSQDISEGYYDTKERLKTFKVEEEGLRKYYESKSPSAKPEDMMAVRRELTQIRANIEEMTGRLKRWDNQVEYATVVVNMLDRTEYVPPVVPNFGGTVGRAFQGSIQAVVTVGKGIVIGTVAASPWLVILAVLGSPWWLRLLRARKPKNDARTPTPASPPAPSA